MSKAFTSEETDDAPVFIRPRAPLPDGVENYVTPAGLVALRAELEALRYRRAQLPSEGDQRQRDREAADGLIAQLEVRLAGARPVDPASQSQDEVRFGATVVLQGEGGAQRTYQLVGVDEADAKQGKIAFVAPIAQALLGRKIGDLVVFTTPRGDEERELISIVYS